MILSRPPVWCASPAALLACALLAAAPSLDAQVKPTPHDDDIPEPLPVEISLAGAEHPDISRFLQVRSAAGPSLSPDGSRLAFRSSITGEPQLWVVDAEGGWPTQLTFGEAVTFHAWSPTGEWILYGADRGGDEREGYYLIRPDGLEERELLAPSDAFRSFGAFSRDGSRIAYGTTERNGVDFDLHTLDVESGEHREVFRGRMGLYPAGFSPEGDAILLTEARGEDANDLYLYDVGNERLDTLFAAATPDDRAAYGPSGWTPDGGGFYLVSDQGREYAGLAFYDVDAGTLDWVETPDHDVDGASLSPDGRYLSWTTNEGGGSVLHLRDLETGRAIPVPDALPGGLQSSAAWAADAPVAAVGVRGPGLPGDLWTWNVSTGAVHRATESSTAGLDMDRMVTPEHVDFPARDGTVLHGLLYLPRDLPAGHRPPVLLSVHGGPTAQARPGFDAAHQYLLTRGIAVFDLNYRGSTGYGKSFARANDGRRKAVEYLDMADAVAWLSQQELVDAGRAAVMGGSYGGYLTMAAMTRLPGVFDAGVAFVGVSDWVTALEGASPQLKASDRIEYGDIDDPDDRSFFENISPITYVDRVEDPVMVLHGANDPRDPVTESDRFVRGIRERGGMVEYLRFPDEGHGIRKLENRIIAYRRIADFLERELEVRHRNEVFRPDPPDGVTPATGQRRGSSLGREPQPVLTPRHKRALVRSGMALPPLEGRPSRNRGFRRRRAMKNGTVTTIPVDPIPSATDAPRTRTGARVRQLVDDVEADLTDVERLLAQAREQLGRLETEARGINGLAGACRGWGQQIDKLIRDLDDERDQVERTMLGSGRPIAATVDQELRDKIRVARGA